MIRAVIFDMDETLLDRQGSLRRFAAAQHAAHRDVLAAIPVVAFVDRFLALDHNGARWKDEVYRRILAEWGVTAIGWQMLLDEYLADFHSHCRAFPGVEAMLKGLANDGRRLGLITNGRSPFQQHNFQALGVADRFDAVLVSGQEGMRKPDPEIFHRALDRLGVAAHEAVFVGDNPEADIRGAQAVGMRAIFRPSRFWPDCPDADAVCTELRDLPALVGRLEASL